VGGPSTGNALEGVTPGTGRGDAGDPDNGGLGGGDGGSGGGDGGSGGGDGGSGGGDGGITPVSGDGDGGAAPGGPPPVVPEEVPTATPPSRERLPAPNTGVRVGVPETVEDEDPPKADEDLSDPIAAADHQRAAGVEGPDGEPDDVVDLDIEAFGDGVEARIGDGDHPDAVDVSEHGHDRAKHVDVEVVARDHGKRCDGGADKHDAASVGVEVRAGDDDAAEDVGVHVREGDDHGDEDVGVEVRAGDDEADEDVGVHVREGDDDAAEDVGVHVREGDDEADEDVGVEVRAGDDDGDEDVGVELDRGDHEADGDAVVEAEPVCDVETGNSCPDDSAADGD
jgi:hypothetical protein